MCVQCFVGSYSWADCTTIQPIANWYNEEMRLLESAKNVFFVGVKGVAMSGLARILSQMGKSVGGSDTNEDQITDDFLKDSQIAVVSLTDNVPTGVDLVVYSAAHGGVESKQVKEAQGKGIVVISQAAVIAELIQQFPISIAICGCHGKTTTSSQTAFILHTLGAKTSWLVGAPYFSGHTRNDAAPTKFPGGHFEKDSQIFVFEADEYGVCPPFDKTPKLLLYHPTHIVCTNIDFDHPDIYRDLEHVKATFDEFFTHAKHVYQSESKSLEGNLVGVGDCLKDLGYEETKIHGALQKFVGVARRLEYHGEHKGIYFYDDYAHHPAEIRVTIDELRKRHSMQRLVVLFQSHTYSRTQALKNEFVEALSHADLVLIDEIFPSAREKEGTMPIHAKDLEVLAQSRGYSHLKGFESRDKLVEYAKSVVRTGDVVTTVGAGDIYKAIPLIK